MSFHESVGLLAICDAIETVEAAASSSSTSTSSSSPSPPPLLPPLVAAHSKQQKQKQKQRQSQKLLFGRYFHRPAKHSHYALKMSSNQASTANNNNNNNSDSSSSSSSSSSPSADGAVNPAAVDAPPAHLSVADLAGMAARERLHDNSAIDPSFLPIDPAIAPMAPADYTASAAAYPSLLSTLAGESAFHTIRRQPVQSQPKRRPQHQSPYDNSMAHQPQHTQHRHQPPQPQHSSQHQQHQQQHQQQQTNQSSIPPEHRSEECHICGRIFRGAKSSTHKQQHIRRLHPDDYQPKRGGKKRAAAAAAAAAAIAATASSGMTSPTPVSSSSHSGTPSGSSASVSLPVMHDYRSYDNSANDDSDESRRRVRPKTEVAVPVDPAIIVADMASESTAALQPSESNVAAALSEFNSSQQPKQENN